MSADDFPQRKSIHAAMEFTAKYPGRCDACSELIAPGQRIVGQYYQSRSGKIRGCMGPYEHAACAAPERVSA